jgi:hypothetical protein
LPRDARAVTLWKSQDEAFVNVTRGIRDAVEKLLEPRKKKLLEYEHEFFKAVQLNYPTSEETHHKFKQLQQELGLTDNDVVPIEQRCTTPIVEFRQKSLRYREEAERLIHEDGGVISTVSRSLLNALRDRAGLSPDEANQVENDLMKRHHDRNGALQEFETAYREAIQTANPLPEITRDRLKRLLDVLELSADDMKIIEARVSSELASPPLSEHDDLDSARNIDYTGLRDALKGGKWKDADRETYLAMLKVGVSQERDWIKNEEITRLDCKDLRTIDRLWVKYSASRFGFSIQKRIWQDLGGSVGHYDHECYKQFGERVGWRVNDEWILYDKLVFNLNAPEGHLPAWYGGLIVAGLFSRVSTCGL